MISYIELTLGTLLLFDVVLGPWWPLPSTELWYKTVVLLIGFLVSWVIEMEDFALGFVFVLRPLLKYKRRKAVADEEEELFTPSLSELLEPPEYKSPMPLGRTAVERLPPPCPAPFGTISCVENVDSAELLTQGGG